MCRGQQLTDERMHLTTGNHDMCPVESKTRQRVRYGQWLLNLVAWDGVMPILVLLAPAIVKPQFPNGRHVVEVMAVAVPIMAFLVRFYIARRHINSNHCPRIVRGFQMVALCLAIFELLLIDSIIILAHEMPNGALFASSTDWIVWGIMCAFYLTCMAFAMYPGRADEPQPTEWFAADSPEPTPADEWE